VAGLVLSLVYAAAIVRVYVRQPATLPEVAGSLTASVGAYRIDQARFEAGLAFFRNDQFVEARDAFAQADPARQDAAVQFYISYAYLRQGWGRVYSDDGLYKAGQATLAHARSLSPDAPIVVADPDLRLHTAEEVAAEFQRGLTRDLSDLNPAGVFKERP
jgi:tetratricopeptide (TPR) repeat protein